MNPRKYWVFQVGVNWRRWLLGAFFHPKLSYSLFVGPLQFELIYDWHHLFEDIETYEHDFQPVEGELGMYQCVGCGEIRADAKLN
jgi:hypothetical protein